MDTSNYRTYQCRINPTSEQETSLLSYAKVYGQAERTLFARLQSGGNLTDLKREFLPKFNLTARQFNAMAATLKGKINSIKGHRAELIKEVKQRIASAKKALKKELKPFALHHKKRQLATLQARLSSLQADHISEKIRLCFGSKKLFRAQFALKAYENHTEWLTDWQSARSSQFFVLGSRDETAGCQGCVATVAEDGLIALRLRLPNGMTEKHIGISGLRFAYGHEAIVAAIGRNLSDQKTDWQAINYRFLRDDKGWRVFVSVSLPEVKCISDKRLGVIGIDINADHLAVTETDRFGNPLKYFSIPCITYGKTSGQRKATVGNAVKQLMSFVEDENKPIVIERLDFQEKKAALEKHFPRYARMLSALTYAQIQAIIRARAFDTGIEVFEVNPAYSSIIGRYKFKDRYGMSGHNASALVIGRRFLGFRETLPSQLHVTLSLSVRNRGGHVWSKWAIVSRKALAVPVAHRQSGISRSLPSPVYDKARLVTVLSVGGEIPPCESSLVPFE